MKRFYSIFLIIILCGLISSTLFAQVTVTFRVDMQEQTVAPEGVHIAGSFQGWNPGATAMTNFIGDVYTYEYIGSPGEYIEYKFVNGNAWGDDEAVPPCCAQNNNRFLTIPEENVVLPTICYGSCNPCNSSPILRDITFQVDFSDVTYTTGAYIAGTLQDPLWTPEPMTDMGNNIFQITFALEEEECYQYKFVLDGLSTGYEVVPNECKSFEGNRFIEVPGINQTLDLVCYNSCVGCDGVDVTFQVDMTNEIVTEGIYVAGSFNGWNSIANPLTDMGSNIWETTITLQNGQDVEYKFINGSDWEVVPAACSWGDGNRHFVVPENPLTLDLVCFDACNACSPANTVDLTFVVDMSSQLVSGTGVFLAGDFNGWSADATPMTNMGNNIYEATVNLGEGFLIGYKFINDTIWENVPGECNYNDVRTVIVPATNASLPLDCFNECGGCSSTLYTFNLAVMLEGAFNGTNMNTTLFDSGVLPTEQPFNVEPWYYDGLETITAPSEAEIVDWVYIQLRETSGDASTAIPDSLLDHQAAVLLSDGTIATPDGNPNIYYTGNITENLYIVIYHRNHLAVMSATPLAELFGTFAYDFTTGLPQAYLDGHKLLGGSMSGMIGGDSDANGSIGTKDKDINWTNEAGSAGYFSSDINLDTQISNPDKNDIWEPNLNSESQVPQ